MFNIVIVSVAICKQETEVGPCDGKFPRWFYNIHERVCDLFFYGGCDGNENRFISKDDCEEMCSSIYGICFVETDHGFL